MVLGDGGLDSGTESDTLKLCNSSLNKVACLSRFILCCLEELLATADAVTRLLCENDSEGQRKGDMPISMCLCIPLITCIVHVPWEPFLRGAQVRATAEGAGLHVYPAIPWKVPEASGAQAPPAQGTSAWVFLTNGLSAPCQMKQEQRDQTRAAVKGNVGIS